MVDFNEDIRTIDGTENQPEDLGKVEGELTRVFPNAYEDGFNAPRGGGIGETESTLPNARDISNIIADQGDTLGNPVNASDWLWQWGQFLDHDLSLSEGSNITDLPDEEVELLQFDITLDPTDVLYGERFTEIPVNRVGAEEGTGTGPDNIRKFPNEITSFVDGSNGYGSENERAAAKRSDLGNSFFGVGTEEVPLPPDESPYDGKLLVANDSYGTNGVAFVGGSDPSNTSGEILAPYNRNNSENADPGERVPNNREFISGDIRINEQVGLTAIHTVLIREHNRLADKVAEHLDAGDDAALNEAFAQYRDEYVPSLELETEPSDAQIRGEFIYEAARAVIGAKSQVITYDEFLPILVGNESAEDLETLDIIEEAIGDPSISASFAGAAYRLGHTLLSDQIRTIDSNGVGSISLREAFFQPDVVSQGGVDNILLGLNYQQANDLDHKVIDGVRNNLFGAPGNGGQDLVAINLQRGRDIGLPGYVEIYNQLNPDSQITSFDDLDPIFGADVAPLFEEAYESIDQIDLWLAGLAEIPEEGGGLLGPTFSAIVEDQFARLRDNDRFFYTDQLEDPESFLSVVTNAIDLDLKNTGLDDILRDNVANPELVPDDAFTVPFENEVVGTQESDQGNNAITGGDTADIIYAQTGNDLVLGGLGDDIIFGESGNDDLRGGEGADSLVGGLDDDFLLAEGDGDVLSGGQGNDTYRFFVETAGGTQIVDEAGSQDEISITVAEGEERTEINLNLIDPNPALMGLRKSGNDLQIDLDQNGILDPANDLVVTDYFADGEDGQVIAGSGAVERVNNLTTDQLLEYANSDRISGGSTIYRFFDPNVGAHFYTASEAERDNILNDPGLSARYNFENESYVGAPHDEDPLTGAKPVYRFLNNQTQVHFYTISEPERDLVLSDPGLSSVFSFEGVAYYGYEEQVEGYTPLYRFRNTAIETPTHFYTPSAGERDFVRDNLGVYVVEGNEEGAAFYIQPLPAEV